MKGAFDDEAGFTRLAETLDKLDAERGTGSNHAFYLAIPPRAFPVVCEQLSKSGLALQQEGRWSRVVIEKPFGHDLQSAHDLNAVVNGVFPEDTVFRIDHYLGKEAVENLLAFRFANTFLEPIWNSNYVTSIQITMAESFGVAGRGKFYDETGAIRDVVQNHLLQTLGILTMDPPTNLYAEALRDEQVKVFRSIPPVKSADIVRGQYDANSRRRSSTASSGAAVAANQRR